MNSRSNVINLSICTLSGVLWGLNDVLTRMLGLKVTQNTLFTIIIFSLVLALLQDSFSTMGILGYRTFKKNLCQNIKFSKPIIHLLIIAAIFAGPLGMCTAIIGIDYAGPVYAGAVTASYPMVTFLLALLLTREKTTYQKTFGTLLAVIGIVAISIEGEQSSIVNISLGLVFAGIAMLGWGMESVILDMAYRRTGLDTSFLLGARQFISATSYIIILLILFFVHGYLIHTILQTLQQPRLVLFCIVTAATSYLAYYYSIKTVGASIATLFNATFVLWDALFAWGFGLGTINPYYWFWAILLVVGIYFTQSNTCPSCKNAICECAI